MFILIHGEDQVKTRQELQNQISRAKKSGASDIVSFSDKTLTLGALIQSIESMSMFDSNNRLTVLENIHKKKSKTELKEITTYLASLDPQTCNLILWENHVLTPTQLKNFSKATIIFSKVSPTIFKLTDAFTKETSVKDIVNLCTSACSHDSPEMVLIMLARQIRLMIQSFDPKSKIPPWQKAKLTTSAKEFGINKLIQMHHQLATIDHDNKTGKLPSDLQSELKTWIININTPGV